MGKYVESAVALQPLLRELADSGEQARHMPAEIAQAFTAAGLYRLAAPEDCFGADQPPREQIGVIEALAQADGSAAWNAMIGIENFGLIAPAFVDCKSLIADPSVIIASSTAAVGRAEKVEGGVRVSGRWQFVSGVHNAHLFGATVRLYEPGAEEAVSDNLYAIVPQGDYEILDTWHTNGMRGSGSHDVVVENVFVPQTQLVSPIGGANYDAPLLNFPLGARLAYNKVAVAWGLARAGIDAFVDLAEGKIPRFSSRSLRERPRAHRAVAEAEVRFRAGKALVLELLDEMWATVQAKGHITTRERGLFQLACSDSVAGCIDAVEGLCRAAGTSANATGGPLDRIARDIRVVGQHATVAPHHMEDAGRVLLGLPAQELMLAGIR